MDTSLAALTKSINTIGTSFEEFKKANDEAIAAKAKGDESKFGELSEKLGKIEIDISAATKAKNDIEKEIEFQRERLEELESRAKSPGKTEAEKIKDEYKENFIGWIRAKGVSPIHEQKMQELGKKDVTIGSSAGGGYGVPTEIATEIEKLELKLSPVRNLVKVVKTGTSDYKELVGIGGTTAGWVGESGSRDATNTSQLREVAPTFGELYAYPQASEWSLDDIFFNVEQWIANEVADAFAQKEANAVLTGNGSSQLTGMLNTAPVATADDASTKRAAAAYQYVLTADNSPAAIDADSLIDLTYTLNSRYRANAVFIMNSLTTGAVRKLKDSNNQYIWQPSLQAQQPDLLLGKRISTWEQMDDVGGGNRPVAFGDFSRGYLLADRVGLRITRDNVTNVGFVRFYVRRREGGIVLNNDAIKFLQCL